MSSTAPSPQPIHGFNDDLDPVEADPGETLSGSRARPCGPRPQSQVKGKTGASRGNPRQRRSSDPVLRTVYEEELGVGGQQVTTESRESLNWDPYLLSPSFLDTSNFSTSTHYDVSVLDRSSSDEYLDVESPPPSQPPPAGHQPPPAGHQPQPAGHQLQPAGYQLPSATSSPVNNSPKGKQPSPVGRNLRSSDKQKGGQVRTHTPKLAARKRKTVSRQSPVAVRPKLAKNHKTLADHLLPTNSHLPPTGDHPPPSGDQPPPSGDQPPPSGDHPPPSGNHPPPSGDHPPPSGNHPPPSSEQLPTSTRRTMEQEIANHRIAIRRAVMLYEDSIEPLQPAEVTLEYLSSKVLVAETQIQAVQEAILFLSTNDEEYYSNRLEASAKDVKKSMLGFVLKAQQILRSANDEAVSLKNNRDKIAETAVKIKSDRVLEYAPGIIQQLTSLAEEIETLASKKPETDQAYYSIAERHLKQQKKAESLLKDGRALSNDAVDCGLTEPAKQLEAAMRHLKLKQNEADTLLTDFKESAGITTGSHPSSKTLDLSPPSFSGEMTDKLDFYSFKQEFEEYSGAKNLSKSEQLRVLLRTSLQGPAQNACTSMKDLAEVWSYLRKLYGNQTILFNSKVEDIRKLGKPTGSLMKKREWAMNVVTKLDSLHEMAKKYKLENELYYGPIVNELKKTLPFNLYKDFKDAVQKQEDEYGITPKNILWDNLLIFLNKYIADLTTEINLDITTNTDGKRDRHDQADQTKASGKKAYSNTRSNNGQGQDRQGKGQSRQGQGQQRQGQSSKQQTGQGQSQPSPPVTAKPALRDCKLCQNQHTHLFYCKKFIRSRIRDRYKLAARMKICFQCLRSDSEVDFKDIDA